MIENNDRTQAIAERFNVPVSEVQRLAREGLGRGLSPDACLVGARLILSMNSGRHELFSLDDVAAALGCTREEAAAEMEKSGVEPIKISTRPGFEWLLRKE